MEITYDGKSYGSFPFAKGKTFSVKAEYADRWTEDAAYPLIVTESEISRLASEWGVSFCELLDQVDEIDND